MKLFRVFLFFLFLSLATNLLYRFDVFGFKSSFAIEFVDKWAAATRKKPTNLQIYQEQLKIKDEENMVLSHEIDKLKKELNVREDFTKEYILADIISYQGNSLIINRGTRNGVKTNQKVIVGKSLIGEVLDVNLNRSLIGLLNNSSLKSYCYVSSGANKVWGVLTGFQEENVLLTRITQDKKVLKNNQVYCEGFYVGKVKEIIQRANELFYEVRVVRAVNPEFLDEVYVVVQK